MRRTTGGGTLKPRLHDTTGCTTSCRTGRTTGCVVYTRLNEEDDRRRHSDERAPVPTESRPSRRRRFYRSNCIRIRTTDGSSEAALFGGAEKGVRVVFGMAVVITAAAVLSLCGLLVVIRRIGRRVSYHEPSRRRWNDCVDDVRLRRRDQPTRTTLIPLNNLVELSSMHVSSSKTSLLHAI